MRIHILAITLTLVTAGALPAQVRVTARLGATWSSTLAEDEIGTPIEVETGIAPTLSLGASIVSGKKYRLGLETILTSSPVEATDDFGTTDLGGLRTLTLLATAGGAAMVTGLHWQLGIGVIKYLPGEEEGLFRQGGPAEITGTFLAEFRRALNPDWEWTVGARYGFHRFITQELESRGYSRGQSVHRIGLEAGISRYFQ
jgi:hypothetical protein